jgi:hypothetical protein
MAIAAKDFKTQNQKFRAGDTVPDDVATERPSLIVKTEQKKFSRKS